MQYNAPYGVSDPNAPYINGNPSTGTMGSIPPAASIEYPQREIVNLISDAAMVPANADLHQLAKAVQSGKLIYADDTGTVNILGLNCVPAVPALQKGMVFITEAAATNTSATIANVNGLTAPVVHASDRTTLLPFDINKGQMIALAFDGANFQLVWSANLPSGGPSVGGGALQANYNIYVDGNIGSDTLYDGTTAAVDAPHGHGPFKTIQKGVDTASKLNANGYTITINVADYAAYAPFGVTNVTNGGLVIKGDSANPAACVITTPTAAGVAVARGVGVGFLLDGFRLYNTVGYGLLASAGGAITFQNIDFSFCNAGHMYADSGSLFCIGNYSISSNANYHIALQYGELILTPSQGNTISIGTVAIGAAFVNATGVGFLRANTTTRFSGGVAGGVKFVVAANAVIDTSGAGVNFFPGATAGYQISGGQYV
jgi:hypothetical protein